MKRLNKKSAIACAVIAAILGIISSVLADDKKEIPDHTNFQSCQTCHAEKQSMWEASGHSKAISRVANNSKASADCYGCHSTEGFSAKQQGNKVDIAQKESFHTISCLACHDPRNSKLPHRLVADPEKLCESCHTQRAVLKGQGAKGIEDSRSFHSGISCVSCHMTEGNHRMEVIRPDSPDLSEKRTDTCTACHKDNNRKARAKQIQDWQSEYKEKMDVLQADINAIGAALKEKPDRLNAGMKSKFSDVRSNLFILTRDGSRGFHNFDYALEIMALASSDLKELKAAVK
jgi:predicted CXXCH cytochrome family protein